MIKQGRQLSPTLAGIREDHKRRYKFAGSQLKADGTIKKVLDAGCGCGYGSFILAEGGFDVISTDIDPAAIDYGEKHYSSSRIDRYTSDWSIDRVPVVDAVVAFEIIEHFTGAPDFLKRCRSQARLLIGSVPNQLVIPFDSETHKYHVRHYTPEEIVVEMDNADWRITYLGGQFGKVGQASHITDAVNSARTIVFVAEAS